MFKLFHLSILWRAAVSERPALSNVRLGPHCERLRRLLLAGEPGPATQYSIFGTCLTDDDHSLFHSVLQPYSQSRVSGHHFYLAIYAACEWAITVSSHYYQELRDAYLTEAGTILLPCCRLVDLPTFTAPFVTFLRNQSAPKRGRPA